MQIALDAELHVAGAARHHGIAHIVARLGGDGQGQVAVHARAVGAVERAGEVQHPGEARFVGRLAGIAGVPGGAHLALRIGVGKLHVIGLHGNAAAFDLPAQVGAQPVQRQQRVFEHARQHQRPGGHRERRLAARLGHVDVHRGAAQAQVLRRRPRGGSGQRQAPDAALDLVLLQGIQGPFPGGLDLIDQALGGVGAHGIVGRGPQGQAAGDLCQRGQVQAVGAELALLWRLARGRRVDKPQVAAGPGQAVIGLELQALGGELEPAVQPPPAQAPLDRRQHQRLQVGAEGGVHIGQRQVGRAAHNLPAAHIGPGAQRAPALRHFNAHVGMVAQLRHIDACEFGKHLAVPVFPVAVASAQQRRAEQAHHGEAVAPGRWGGGVQPHVVVPVAVAQHQVDLLQRQRGGAALLVGPAHGAVLDEHFALRKKPVGRVVVVALVLGKLQPRHIDAAIGGTAHVQLRPLYIELLEPALEQRAGRQRHHHPGQVQGRAARGVQQRHVRQLDRRHQPLGAGRDGADLDGNPQSPCGMCLQLWAKVPDSRHNPAMKGPPSDGQQQPEGQQQPQ